MVSDRFKSILQIASTSFLIFMGNIDAGDGLQYPPTRPGTQAKTVDIVTEALYWYTSETADWCFTLSSDANSVQSEYINFLFDWAPGFRVGLGYNMEHDLWDTQANYTWFQSRASDSVNQSVKPTFFGARLSALEPFSTGKATLNLDYNMFSWDLGRSFFVSEYLSLRPSIGLKGGWINQSIHSEWTIPNFLDLFLYTANENLKQRFRAGGLKGSLSGNWCLGKIQRHSFNLIGEFDAGYLWGHWDIQDKFIDNLNTVIPIITANRNFGSIVFHSFLGFGWDFNFDRNKSHFGLKIGYEIEDWLNQFQIFSDASGAQNNDLILQGLNLAVRFDF